MDIINSIKYFRSELKEIGLTGLYEQLKQLNTSIAIEKLYWNTAIVDYCSFYLLTMLICVPFCYVKFREFAGVIFIVAFILIWIKFGVELISYNKKMKTLKYRKTNLIQTIKSMYNTTSKLIPIEYCDKLESIQRLIEENKASNIDEALNIYNDKT